jgi:hypothetical protein
MNYPGIYSIGLGLMSEYNFVDYEFEIATMSGLYIALPLYALRFNAAEKKIKERNIQMNLLKNEKMAEQERDYQTEVEQEKDY